MGFEADSGISKPLAGLSMAITVTSNEEPASMRQRRAEAALDPTFWQARGPDAVLFSPATRWREGGRALTLTPLPPVERAAGHQAVSQLL